MKKSFLQKFKHFLAMSMLALAAVNSYAAGAQAVDLQKCQKNLPWGAPSLPDKVNLQVCHDGYAALFNTHTKTPLWVAQHLKKEAVGGAAVRATQFSPDPQIPARLQAKKSDYVRTRDYQYDQGHMAPAADFSQDQTLMDESFHYTNVVPQNPENNRRIWAGLEKKVRSWLYRRGELYVVTGPIFKDGKISQTIGRSQVAVPDYLFKAVLDPRTQSSIAFILPNAPIEEKDLPQYIVSVREVEKLSGLNFHSRLSAEAQDKIETRRSGMWTR